MVDHVVTIDMGKPCAECGKGGAVPNGLCLKCTTKAMDPKATMKTANGRAVQARWQEKRPKSSA